MHFAQRECVAPGQEITMKLLAILLVLTFLCLFLVILWSALAISSQISRLEEEHEHQQETAHSRE